MEQEVLILEGGVPAMEGEKEEMNRRLPPQSKAIHLKWFHSREWLTYQNSRKRLLLVGGPHQCSAKDQQHTHTHRSHHHRLGNIYNHSICSQHLQGNRSRICSLQCSTKLRLITEHSWAIQRVTVSLSQ